jgi:hypothetical protein
LRTASLGTVTNARRSRDMKSIVTQTSPAKETSFANEADFFLMATSFLRDDVWA